MSSHTSDSDGALNAQEENWEDWEDDESAVVKSLFSDDTFASVDEALAFDLKAHSFDLKALLIQTRANLYDTLKLINYIRLEVANGRDPRSTLTNVSSLESGPWQEDAYLKPVLDNDELLLHEWDEEEGAAAPHVEPDEDLASLMEEMKLLAAQDDSVRELLASSGDQANGASSSQPQPVAAAEQSKDAEAARIDDNYFESYSFFDIHREMLSDKVRTEAYRKALENNPSLMEGATVLDVGCGTGVLSMFAVRGGASRVVAVDGSREIASFAKEICAANGFGGGQEGPVVVVSSRVESLQQLPVDTPDGKVDVLVSEWMGYALLFESMLDSVLLARDRYLRAGGAILPDVARIFIAAANEAATGIDFWRDVYGLNMGVVADSLRQSALEQGIVRVVNPASVLTEGQLIKTLDLATMAATDQDFSSDFELPAGASPGVCHALVLWFDTLFTQRFCKEAPQELPTGPHTTPTHWAQTVLPLPAPVRLARADAGVHGAAIALKGRVSLARRGGRHRTLDISVEYSPMGVDGNVGESKVQLYSMGVSNGGPA